MSRIPSKKPRQVIDTFRRAGFVLEHIKGSHYFFVHPKDAMRIFSVAHHARDMKRTTLAKTIKHSGLTLEEFIFFDP